MGQCLTAMAAPLWELDQYVFANCTESSLAYDEAHGLLLVRSKHFLPWGAVYETILGAMRSNGNAPYLGLIYPYAICLGRFGQGQTDRQ